MMDCNKEEAVRAKGLAEKKMLGKDFLGAKKVAIRAQQLYPELDNISQMLAVCDIHCSAEKKVLGAEMNWYAILQIEQTADEALIKKQYRKLALLLHPDKNKFAGAEAAFKLIGEAQRVLSDPSKRSVFDMKYRAAGRTALSRPPQQSSRNAYVAPQFTTMNPHQRQQQQQRPPQPPQPPQQQQQTTHPNGRQTFWTVCPFCNIRYQYYNDVVNRPLRCQSCFKTFFAYDLDGQSVPPNSTQSQFSQEKVVFNRGSRENASQVNTGNSSSGMGFQGNAKVAEPYKKPDGASVADGGRKTDKDDSVRANWGNGKVRNEEPTFRTGKSTKNRKRGRNQEESSESCDTEDSSETENDEIGASAQPDSGAVGESNRRRSSRQKQQVSYNENLSDDEDFVRPPKRQKESGMSDVREDMKRVPVKEETFGVSSNGGDVSSDEKEGRKRKGTFDPEENFPNAEEQNEKRKQKGKEAVVEGETETPEVCESESIEESAPKVFEVPDPDFYVFDDDRKKECFDVEQIWAIYDTADGMPRFYALIKKVFNPGFKVRIMWLEADPLHPEESEWADKDLPVACGRFKYGKSEVTEALDMFAHLTTLKFAPKARYYWIYPQKGEVWAIFKNWDINWKNNPDDHKNYEFEYVQVLSEYSEGSSISVGYLVKIKGFVSLFRQKMGIDSFEIPPNELLRFSHRIQFYKTTGKEREDIPEGYFELDTASLPSEFVNCADAEDLIVDVETIDVEVKGSCSKSSANGRPGISGKSSNRSEIDSPKNNSLSRKGSLRKSAGVRIADGQAQETAIDDKGCDREPIRTTRRGVSAQTRANCVIDELRSPQSFKEPGRIPDPVFNDFEVDRSPSGFEAGQIWALCCDLDGLPKCYAHISKVVQAPKLVLHINQLEALPLPRTTIQWFAKDMPITCGKFKLASNKVLNVADSFCHLVQAKVAGRERYEILPAKGEVWALYKDFDSEWTCSDLRRCEYEMVEVLDVNQYVVKVLVLVLEDSYETIFRPKKEGRGVVTKEVPRVELLRFSHRVPAFRLIDELDCSLKGCWELDPKSIPVSVFRSPR